MKNILLLFLAVGLLASCQNAPKGAKATTEAAKEVVKQTTTTDTRSMRVTPGGTIAWSGKKIAGEHSGSINISNGKVTVEGDKITAGKFMIDMNSISCSDLEAGKGKEKLEGHLKSADFFNVAKFPTSSFNITNIQGKQVTGNLRILGVTKSITFEADMVVSEQGVSVTSPFFKINRTDWGLKYGSASFFDDLKDKAINDEISLQLNFKAS